MHNILKLQQSKMSKIIVKTKIIVDGRTVETINTEIDKSHFNKLNKKIDDSDSDGSVDSDETYIPSKILKNKKKYKEDNSDCDCDCDSIKSLLSVALFCLMLSFIW